LSMRSRLFPAIAERPLNAGFGKRNSYGMASHTARQVSPA
jgi:hypothetical protein